MNRKICDFTVIFLALVFILFLISANNIVLESVSFSISIWRDNLFPTLFPFFVASNILIQYGFIDILGKYLSVPMKKIFKLPGSSSFVLINSLFSGFPSGAKYATSLVKENKLSKNDAARLLTFTHYSNPLFIMGFIGGIILDKKAALIILISHILGGLLVGKIFSLNNKTEICKEEVIKQKNKFIPFGKALSNSVLDSLNTMFLLLGIVTIFTLITSLSKSNLFRTKVVFWFTILLLIFIFTSFISNLLNLSILEKCLLSGILEMTQGIKNIASLEISNYLKAVLTSFFISFGGISVHMQVLSIIAEYNIKYKPFFIARILHSILTIGLVSIFYYFTY